jgi:hypothetical protein
MGSTDATSSLIQQLRGAMLATKATVGDLDGVGNNHGVPRPQLSNSDTLYRALLFVLMWQPKAILSSVYNLLGAVFGTQEVIRSGGGRPWRVYEVNANEIVIEVPSALVAGTTEIASYLHGANGFARVPAGPSNTFTTDFDLSLSSAVTIVGLNIYVETAPGTWTTYTVSAYSFSAGTATVQVSAATLPTGGGSFYLEVPGDLVASYRGDYLATGGEAQSTYSTAAGPLTNTLLVVGDVTQSVQPSVAALISISGVFQTRIVSTIAYNNATNVTTVVLTTTDVPGGQANQVFLVVQELADTGITPPHNDRIYLTGTGLYQVVQFYLDLLVRAAGIVVRLEIV